MQSIDATPYLGKKTRLKAAVKAKTDSSTFAFLHLLIEANTEDETYNGDPPLFDSLDKFRIKGNEWQEIVIEAYVPENAHTITYSTHLRDFGTVWIDAIEIEIIE